MQGPPPGYCFNSRSEGLKRGALHSGVPLHIHGPGFSETIIGRKRWWLSPPKPKPKFDPNVTPLQWALGLKPGSGGNSSGSGRGGRGRAFHHSPSQLNLSTVE